MKHIILSLGFLLINLFVLSAQTPNNRTTTTIIADVLAQMPAQNNSDSERFFSDLLSTGEEGIIQLSEMMTPGKGDNALVEFALSGLVHFVSQPDKESQRLLVSKALMGAVRKSNNLDVMAFLISQLEIVGKDEAVPFLTSFVGNRRLNDPAIAALTAINTTQSKTALIQTLKENRPVSVRKSIILSLGKMQSSEAEEIILPMLKIGNLELNEAIYYALGRGGSKISLPILAEAAKKVNYAFENTGATDNYLLLIQRLSKTGESKKMEKAADDLMNKSSKAKQYAVAAAAMILKMQIHPDKTSEFLKEALKNKNSDYRNAVLYAALDQADIITVSQLRKFFKKASLEVKTEIINGFSYLLADPEKKYLLNSIESNFLITQTKSKDANLKNAAMEFLAKSGRPDAIKALANLLISPDTTDVFLAQNALTYSKASIADEIAPLLDKAGDPGKIAILQLLASRKADSYFPLVLEQLSKSSPEVSRTAYKAMSDMVTADNLDQLYNLLANSDETSLAPVQHAIISALQAFSPERRTEMVFRQIDNVQREIKPLYYEILATCETNEAMQYIIDSFLLESGKYKDFAFKALLQWPDISIAGELLEVCENPPRPEYFNQALNRYIQLASSSQLTGENQRLLLTEALKIAQSDTQKNSIIQRLGRTNTFMGLLIAGKYLDEKNLQQSAAQAVMKIALDNPGFYGENVNELLSKVSRVLNNPDAEYEREAIKTFIEERKTDEVGFRLIYNEMDLSGWQGIVENPIARAKMKPAELTKKQIQADKIARTHWLPRGDILMFDGTGGENLCTIKQYGDFEMFVDWKLDPSSPEADAGIYLRGTPQVQIWDISRTNVGAQVGSGGLYNNQQNPSDPIVLADNPLGEWNTFHIKMLGDRVTVKLNGILVVDNTILENYWNRSLPIFPKEQIELQAHQSIVYYRNIYVKELGDSRIFELTEQEQRENYRVLFDGSNMLDWTGNTNDYRLEQGCISLHPSQGQGGNLYTKDEFDNFIFRFEFQLTPGANNGLGIRTPTEGDPAYVGMELQILDDEAPIYRDLANYQYHGSVYGVIPSKRGSLKPIGEWNYQEVIADGDNITITLNGNVIVDGNLRDATVNGTPDKQDHPGLFNKKGHIGFLGHGSPVKFKNIRIKELK